MKDENKSIKKPLVNDLLHEVSPCKLHSCWKMDYKSINLRSMIHYDDALKQKDPSHAMQRDEIY